MKCPEGCMKQIHDTLMRVFAGNKPLPSSKWKAIINISKSNGHHYLCLFHYHHLVLIYDIDTHEVLHEWHEKPADKRGFDSAIVWLKAFNTYTNRAIEDCSHADVGIITDVHFINGLLYEVKFHRCHDCHKTWKTKTRILEAQ